MFQKFQLFSAPMAGITDKPFRRLLRKCNPDIALMTEMISCHSLTEQHKKCKRNFDRYEDEGLIGAQIFGADARLMAESAKILEQKGASWIDINMGCPVPKVATRAGAGAFLMRDHKLAGQIVSAVALAVKIPVSIKTRLGWDAQNMNWPDLIRIAGENGAQWATLHGRTRAQGYSGKAELRQMTKSRGQVPIVANGDIKNSDDLERIKKLGYDGAMIGRAFLGNPSLLSGRQLSPAFCLEHFDLAISYYGELAGVLLFRKHAAWYSTGRAGANEFRQRVNSITDAQEMRLAIKDFFA